MPQIQFETYASQIFWLFFFFSVLVCVSQYRLPSTALSFLERRRTLENINLETKKLEGEVDTILRETKLSLDEARSNARDLILNVERECLVKVNEEKRSLVKELRLVFLHEREQLYKDRIASKETIQTFANSVAVEITNKISGWSSLN